MLKQLTRHDASALRSAWPRRSRTSAENVRSWAIFLALLSAEAARGFEIASRIKFARVASFRPLSLSSRLTSAFASISTLRFALNHEATWGMGRIRTPMLSGGYFAPRGMILPDLCLSITQT